MVLVTTNEYDDGLAGGDGNLTKATQHVDATTTRVTSFLYDWRNRRIATDGEIDFYQKVDYDNLDRIVKTERFDTTASGNLVARDETLFDERGRTYRTIRYGVDPNTGAVGNALTDNSWFDANGNVIKSQPAGSKLFTKSVFDGLGRSIRTYIGFDLGETSHADADAGTIIGDTILEQAETVYDDASNVIQTTNWQRYHNATGTGALNGPSGPEPKARVTYAVSYFDAVGRSIATVDYGTNGGASLVRPAIVPTRSDTVLVTSTVHDDVGEIWIMTDPAGKEDRVAYDDAGRRITLIENYVDGVVNAAAPDEDRTTQWTFTPDGQVASLTAVNPETGDQTTTYTYGTTLIDSGIATSTLKRFEAYPDSAGGGDRVAFTYNRQRETTSLTDQNGSIHAYDYDLLGRPTQDRITTLGSGADGAVRRIATAYEVRGLRQVSPCTPVPSSASATPLTCLDFGRCSIAFSPTMAPISGFSWRCMARFRHRPTNGCASIPSQPP